jgi:PAS domain S-box-containing protein
MSLNQYMSCDMDTPLGFNNRRRANMPSQITAAEIMVPPGRFFESTDRAAKALDYFATSGDIEALVVDPTGRIAGCTNVGLILKNLGPHGIDPDLTVTEVSQNHITSVLASTQLEHVPTGHRVVAVVDEHGRPVGKITAENLSGILHSRVGNLRFLLDQSRVTANTLEALVESAFDCVVVVDDNGIVTMFNEAYEKFLNKKREDVIGRHVQLAIENTRMHIVVKTGVPEIGHRMKINGKDVIVKRIPIKKDGRIVGAVGTVMFRSVDDLESLVQKLNLLEKRVEYYERELRSVRHAKYSFDDLAGSSQPITEVKQLGLRAARGHSTILIRGESGTGKELLAHAIHNASPRAHGPFIRVNCAAVPKDLLESELFGYESGAFTGAKKGGKPGKFEMANGGTIFLDEIGDMPLDMQAKVLRVIQEKEIEKVGGAGNIEVNVRIIAATNKDLEAMVSENRFREDLYYRLNVVGITMPSLRDRPEDIPVLVEVFMDRLCADMGVPRKAISPESLELLKSHPWPGNARELLNVLERLMNTVDEDIILPQHLPFNIKRPVPTAVPEKLSPALRHAVKDTEKQVILDALKAAGGNKVRAAEALGIHRSVLYQKLKKYDIS